MFRAKSLVTSVAAVNAKWCTCSTFFEIKPQLSQTEHSENQDT